MGELRLCACGCGRQTKPARVTDKKKGWVKGEPLKYIHRHKVGMPWKEVEGIPLSLDQKERARLFHNRAAKNYYHANHEVTLARGQTEARQKYKRRWRLKNRARLITEGRAYYQATRQKQILASREFRRTHKEWARKYFAAYRSANPEKIGVYHQARRAREVGALGTHTAEDWKAILSFYGHRCLRCNRDDVKLCKDHIVPLSRGGTNDISNLQPLCKSCNSAKRDKIIDYRPIQPKRKQTRTTLVPPNSLPLFSDTQKSLH